MSTTATKPERTDTDRGGAERCCHLRKPGAQVAVCGARPRRFHRGDRLWDGTTICPVCGAPMCRACMAIVDSYVESGAWEGEGEAP